MAERIKTVAQISMDAFYQDYKPATAFLRLEHFTWLCVAADAKLKQNEYKEQVLLNLRRRAPHAPVILGADNYVSAEVVIKKGKALLPDAIMMFPGAKANMGISHVVPEGNCAGFIPVTEDEKWQVCNIKDVVFWFPVPCGIGFLNLEICNPKKVTVTYIAQLSSGSTVQESRKWDILNMVTIYIKSAKDGVIIDMSNDGNSNASNQTEINKYLLKALQK